MNRKLADKYFDQHCSVREAKLVLKWFDTSEGQAYLKERLESDIKIASENEILPLINEEISDALWDNIDHAIKSKKNRHSPSDESVHSQSHSTYFTRSIVTGKVWYLSTAIVLLLGIITLFLMIQSNGLEEDNSSEVLTYKTTEVEHKKITLSDNTVIDINSNSEIRVPDNYGIGNREVWLQGEAYFDVKHNDEKPFIVQTEQTTIKDLGTAFNIKATNGAKKVKIAVTEGEVVFWDNQSEDQQRTHLKEGQFASFDTNTQSIELSEFGIENYIVWLKGRLNFEQASLEDVTRQLENIYDLEISFTSERLKSLKLSANFSCNTAKKALDVITITLNLTYSIEGNSVVIKNP